jgi:hypothetical protein
VKKGGFGIGLFCFLIGLVEAALAQPAGWQEVLFRDEPATRFVSGIWHRDRVYGGTHNPGSVYAFGLSPLGADRKRDFFPHPQAPTEAVLDLVTFQDELFGVVEKSPSEIRRLNRETGAWEAVDIPSREGFYFGAVFQGKLYVSGGHPQRSGMTLFRSADGRRFVEAAQLPDWAWIPVVFQEDLYFLGHKGAAYSNRGTVAFRSRDGSRFEAVAALEVEFQYQCAVPWEGQLYLGTGGWTVNRTAKNQARIYRFDGKKREQVLADIQLNGITSLAACGRHLYALADSGWETPTGSSALYRTADGENWGKVRTFPVPELRKIVVVAGKHLLLLGGKNREYGAVYLHENYCE